MNIIAETGWHSIYFKVGNIQIAIVDLVKGQDPVTEYYSDYNVALGWLSACLQACIF